jgi:hypothetical protein
LRATSAQQLSTAKAEAEFAKYQASRAEAYAAKAQAHEEQARRLLSRLSSQVARIEALTKPKPKPPPALPADYDDAMREIWPRVKDRTMTGHEKVFLLTQAVQYLERYRISGAVVECGVWRGGSMLAVAEMLLRLGSTGRDLYLFDTFEGMSEPGDRDVHLWTGSHASELIADKIGGAPIWEAASLEDVRSAFAVLAYPQHRLHFVKGKVEDTIPAEAPEEIALLRLDTDWYESTRHEFEHLYSRLVPGGILIIDDYGSWQGSKEATDQFLDLTGEPIMLVRVNRGRVGVKPGLESRVDSYDVASDIRLMEAARGM